MIRFFPVIGIFLAMTACSHPVNEITHAYYAQKEKSAEPDDRLKLAAFEKLQGMSSPEALTFLVANGFTCEQLSCRYETIKKQSSADIMFGIAFPTNNVFGHRQAYKHTFEITLSEPGIEIPDDIVADARFEAGTVPWHSSPQPSDFEVTDD